MKRTLVTGGSGFIVLKTEGDKQLLGAYDDFWSGIETMKKMPINDFCTSSDFEVRKHYFAVRKYLNVYELVAIGIKTGMFDDQTCYDFWCGVLCRCVEAAQPVLAYVRARPGRSATYSELENLYLDWKKRDIRAGTNNCQAVSSARRRPKSWTRSPRGSHARALTVAGAVGSLATEGSARCLRGSN